MNTQRNSVKNTAFSTMLFLAQFICNFIGRKLIISYIGLEVLGVNSVVVDTVSMLSLCELGIQTSIIYKMYEAISTNNIKKQNELFSVFRYAYKIIGIAIFLLGVCLTPFVQRVVNSSLDRVYILSIYYIQLIVVALNYFFSCPRLLYLSNQKQAAYLKQDILFQCIVFALQVVTLIHYKSYILYISLSIIKTVFPNIYLRNRLKKDFSYIDYRIKPKIEDIKSSFYDIRDILIGTIATFIYTSTDNFIISYVFGAITVGLIANYKTITNAVKQVIELFSNSMSPVWGNYLYKGVSKDSVFSTIRLYNFVEFIICSILLIPTVALSDTFISIWIGNEFVISRTIIYLVAADLFLNSMQQSFCMVIRSYGLFKEDKFNSFIAAFLNLSTSIVLCKIVGIEGVLIGTVISLLWFFFSRMRTSLKRLELNRSYFYIMLCTDVLQYVVVSFTMLFFSNTLMSWISIQSSIIRFLVCGCAIELSVLIMIIIFFCKTERMKQVKDKIIKPIMAK